jgi:MFS family permease
VAWWAPSYEWFYLVVILAGIANVAVWTVGLAMTLEFGTAAERPVYIGLTNSLVAPVTLLLPIAGGSLANVAGYEAAFIASAIGGVLTALVLVVAVRNPRHMVQAGAVGAEAE